jgi:hypothetical protein
MDFMADPFYIFPALNYQKQSYKVNAKEEMSPAAMSSRRRAFLHQ